MIPAKERSFGLEIETIVPTNIFEELNARSHLSGPQVPRFPHGWEARTDGSIRPNERNMSGLELVSPVLSGRNGLEQSVLAVHWLKAKGAKANASTGLHVHVGAQDLTLEQVRSVRRAFIHYEMAFLALNGTQSSSRYSNRYCKLSDRWEGSIMEDDRYRSLNLTNWHFWHERGTGKPTLECRIWQSVLDDRRVVTAIQFFVALVSRAAEYRPPSRWPREDNARKAFRAFLKDHFGKQSAELLHIVPEEPIADVLLPAWHDVTQSRY